MSTFCQRLYYRKWQRRGVGGHKKPEFANVVCERPLRVLWTFLNTPPLYLGTISVHKIKENSHPYLLLTYYKDGPGVLIGCQKFMKYWSFIRSPKYFYLAHGIQQPIPNLRIWIFKHFTRLVCFFFVFSVSSNDWFKKMWKLFNKSRISSLGISCWIRRARLPHHLI